VTVPTIIIVGTSYIVGMLISAARLPAAERIGTSEFGWNCSQFGTSVWLLVLAGPIDGEIATLQPSFLCDDICEVPSQMTKSGRTHSLLFGSQAQSPIRFPARARPNCWFNVWSKSK
jgi:hypothetical protein